MQQDYRVNELAPDQHAALIIANLPTVADDLKSGAIVSLSQTTSASGPYHSTDDHRQSAGATRRTTEPLSPRCSTFRAMEEPFTSGDRMSDARVAAGLLFVTCHHDEACSRGRWRSHFVHLT